MISLCTKLVNVARRKVPEDEKKWSRTGNSKVRSKVQIRHSDKFILREISLKFWDSFKNSFWCKSKKLYLVYLIQLFKCCKIVFKFNAVKIEFYFHSSFELNLTISHFQFFFLNSSRNFL